MSPGAKITTGSIKPHLYVLLSRLESYCWSRAWLWASNREIGDEMGLSERGVQRGLEQLEELGIVARVMTDRHRPERLGIVLLKRINPTRPYCRTSKQLQDIAYSLRDSWADKKHIREQVNPVILAGDPELAKQGSEENREIPRKNGAAARHERRAQHDTADALSTSRASSERIRLNSQTEPQQTPPVLKIAGEPELTPEALQAVESIRKAVETSDRPEAAQGVVEVARAALSRGHGPGRVADLAREAMKPGITNPGGWLRRVIEMRGADEGGVLRDRPKPPPPPVTPTLKINEAEAAIYENAIRTGQTGLGIGRKPARAWRVNNA